MGVKRGYLDTISRVKSKIRTMKMKYLWRVNKFVSRKGRIINEVDLNNELEKTLKQNQRRNLMNKGNLDGGGIYKA